MNTPVRVKTGLITAFMRALSLAGPALLAMAANSASAQTTYYWDGNGATTGSGSTTLAGNWGGGSASAFWGTSAVGTSSTTAATLTGADTAVFSANDGTTPLATNSLTNYNGNYTVTLGAAQSVAGVVLSGAATLTGTTGGTLTLAGTGSPGLTVGAGGITMNGSSGDPTLAASIGTITLGADQTWTVNNAHVWTVNAAVSGNATAGNTRTWTLGYVNAFTNVYSGIISDGGAGGKLALTLNNTNGSTGGGTQSISGTANTYTGKTTITRGILQVALLANAGSNSSLGAASGSDSIIDIGSGTNSGSLYVNGSAASTSNRVINLAGTTGGAVIKNNNSTAANTVTLSGGITNAGGGNKTLTLAGTNTGANTVGVIADAADLSKTALLKSEAGLWTLNGTNTYTGGTTISLGTLAVSSGSSLGANVAGNNITINGGNLLLSAATNFGASQTISISSGGIGVGYTPASLPTVTDTTGSTGGVYGINYSGDGAVTSLASLYNGNWFLGSFTTGTYTGSSLASGNTSKYRLGGGGGTLTIQNSVLTGANDAVIGGTGGGNVILAGSNTFTGKTTLQNGTLTVSSLNNVSGGSASSSLGAPTTVPNGTIDIGSTTNAVTLAYTGTGETTDRVLNFTGTTGAVSFTNSGTGNLNFSSAVTFTGTGARTITLGTSADTYGGSLNTITNAAGSTKVSVTKNGLSNSTWTLAGTSAYTGDTIINGGVISASDLLPNSYIKLNGSSGQQAVFQSQGTLTRTLSSTSATTNMTWPTFSGFAAKGGKLTVTLNANAQLVWGTTASFMGTGTSPMVLGSSTADNQVEVTNAINLNTNDAFNRVIYVEKGAGGDSALLSGVISQGVASTSNNGIVKDGKGTLILSNTNTYGGATIIRQGTIVAGASSLSGSNGSLGNGTGTTAAPTAPSTIQIGEASTGVAGNPTLLIGGAFTVGRNLSINDNGTGNTYGIGGSTDNSATFSGTITVANGSANNNTFSVTQVATTGGNALNITGGISGAANANTKTVSFDNVGDVNVTTTAIADGAGGGKLSLAKTGAGTLTLSATSTYTGVTTLTGGVLSAGTLANGGTNSSIGASTNAAANLVFNGGTLLYTGATASTDRNFTLNTGTTGTINVGNGATNLTVSGASTATTGGLTKTGAGTLTLGGANLYTGTTTISAGTLALGSSGSIAGSAIVNLGTSGSQGILDVSSKSSFAFGTGQTLSGYGTVNIGAGKAVTINGSLAPGNSPGITTITGDLVLANAVAVPTTGAITTMELGGNGGVAGTDYDKVVVSGQVTFGGTLSIISYLSYNINQDGTYHLFSFGSQTGSFDFVSVAGSSLTNSSGVWSGTASGFDYTFTESTGDLMITVGAAIPEPSTYAALAGGVALLGACLVRRRKTIIGRKA